MAYFNGNQILGLETNVIAAIVDQTYNPTSENAQSGKAVKEAIDGLQWENLVNETTTEDLGIFSLSLTEKYKEFYIRIIMTADMTSASALGRCCIWGANGATRQILFTDGDGWIPNTFDNKIFAFTVKIMDNIAQTSLSAIYSTSNLTYLKKYALATSGVNIGKVFDTVGVDLPNSDGLTKLEVQFNQTDYPIPAGSQIIIKGLR